MKTRQLIVIAVAPLLHGCWDYHYAGPTVTRHGVDVTDVAAHGPSNQPPIHITAAEPGERRTYVSPRASYNSTRSMSGSLNDGVFTEAHGGARRLTWDRPMAQLGIDIDAALSEHTALSFGVATSAGGGGSFHEGYAAIGFYERTGSLGARLDFGIAAQQAQYDALTVRDGSAPYHDQQSPTFKNYFATATLNSVTTRRVNIFTQFGFATQRLTGFNPKSSTTTDFLGDMTITTDLRKEAKASWLQFAPGVYFNLNDSKRIMMGVRGSYLLGINEASRRLFWTPVLKVDWRL